MNTAYKGRMLVIGLVLLVIGMATPAKAEEIDGEEGPQRVAALNAITKQADAIVAIVGQIQKLAAAPEETLALYEHAGTRVVRIFDELNTFTANTATRTDYLQLTATDGPLSKAYGAATLVAQKVITAAEFTALAIPECARKGTLCRPLLDAILTNTNNILSAVGVVEGGLKASLIPLAEPVVKPATTAP